MKVFQIVEKRNLWFLVSALVILVGFGLMFQRSLNQKPLLNFGIDFVGGSTMILKFDSLQASLLEASRNGESSDDVHIAFIKELRSLLKDYGLQKSSIQITDDSEVIIKTLELESSVSTEVRDFLGNKLGSFEVLEIDYIGPTIGAELREKSLWITLIVAIALLLYITWRFEFVFGLAALAAVLHDALVTISVASLLSIEINTAFVAAVLTILGYSINDTIVVFDRIRENVAKLKTDTLNHIANVSIAQTITRTINTSITTLMVIGCLILFGGTTIRDFSLVLFIGILVGTYSSVFIASPILCIMGSSSESEEEA